MDADTGSTSGSRVTTGPISAGPISSVELGSFTASRVERTIEVVVGFGCLVLGLQGLVAALTGAETDDLWHPALELLMFTSLALMIVACFVGRAVRAFAGIFAVVGVIAIGLWPFVHTAHIASTQQPWIFYLINVITAGAVVSFPLSWQIVWVFLLPAEWLVVRIADDGVLAAEILPFLLEASFALVFGAIVVTLGWLFRRAAATVDRRRAVADAAYAEAVAADAAEQERLAVGALMHDSVLSALIAAARGHSPRERTLAVSMASEALTRLADTEHDAEIGPEGPVSLAVVARQLERAAADLGHPITVDCTDEASVPGAVARALAMAGVQAISNAVEHADGAGLTASVSATEDPLAVRVVVSDAGGGFDTAEVPEDRLGISASIMARMAAVRGHARVSSDANGTRVALEWTATAVSR